jgi:glycosyltransferase involved in cell wall biosynthesis
MREVLHPAAATSDVAPISASRPARILVAHAVPRTRTGGMSRIMGEIHDRIAGDEYEVEYFCSDDVPAAARGRASRLVFPLALYAYAARAARAGRPYDLINVHEPSAVALAAWRARIGHPVIVVTSHGVERRVWERALEERRLGRSGPSLKTRVIYPMTSLWQSTVGLRRADHLFCLSSEDRHYLAEWLGRTGDDVTRITPAADPQFARAASGRDYGRAARILFAGTWRKNKGVEDLVPAFTRLARENARLSLTVLGAGVPDEVVHAAFPSDVRPRVLCIHPKDDATIAAALAAADLFVLPSLFEGTPLTLVEAMAAGLPIVTTATCGMLDVIDDGCTGLLVPIRSPDRIADAMSRLVASPELRTQLGRAAHAQAVREHSWDRVAIPVRAVYDRLLGERLAARNPPIASDRQ